YHLPAGTGSGCAPLHRGPPDQRQGADYPMTYPIGITLGDPAGIGPDIIVKMLATVQPFHGRCVPIVFGDARVLEQTASALGLPVTIHTINHPNEARCEPGVIDLID